MTSRHIPAITGLRALAVMSVVAFHINRAWLPGGFVGVDVFFVISGFVVAHSVTGAHQASFQNYFVWFYKRRVQRILPAAFVYILIATIAAFVVVPLVPPTKFIEPTGIAAIFAASNVALFLKSGDYFATQTDYNLFTHMWSLSVEEQYYLIFPFFSYAIFLAEGYSPKIRGVALRLVVAASLGSLVAAALISVRNPTFAFYMLPTRFWELGMGFLLRVFSDARSASVVARRQATLADWIGAAALVLLAWSFWSTDPSHFPWPGALPPCLATTALIWLAWSAPGSWTDRLLSLPPLLWLGNISYSLYLWHWGVVVVMRWTTGIDTLPLQLLALLAMILLAWLSYAYVERPFRERRRERRSASRLFIRYGAAATGLAVIASGGYALKHRYGLAAANRAAWDNSIAPGVSDVCAATKVPSAVGPGIGMAFRSPCIRAGAPRLIVIGDSHAGAYVRSLLRIAASGEFEPYLLTLGRCSIVYVVKAPPITGCTDFRNAALLRARALARPGDVVLLAGLQTPRFAWTESPGERSGDQLDPPTMTESRARLQTFASLGVQIVVEGPKPVMPFALYRCADWFNRSNPDCRPPQFITAKMIRARMAMPRAGLIRVISGLPAVTLWDPADALCDQSGCSAYHDGQPIYFDTDHLSGYGNDLVLPSMITRLRAVTTARD